MSHIGKYHEYNPREFWRDDIAFYTQCIVHGCNHIKVIDAATESDYLAYWGLDSNGASDNIETDFDDCDYPPGTYYR